MKVLRRISSALVSVLIAALALAIVPAGASAASQPVWRITVTPQQTNFVPGEVNDGGFPAYVVTATNIGSAPTSGSITISDALPEGVLPAAGASPSAEHNTFSFPCSTVAQTITCTDPDPLSPGEADAIFIPVDVTSTQEGSIHTDHAEVSGGGALPASAEFATKISSSLPPFGFLPGPNGLSGVLNEADGSPATQAGSHPYQLTVDLALGSRRLQASSGAGADITGLGGGLRDLVTDLPRGMVANPAATPVLCTEAQLESRTCPDSSAVGLVTLLLPSVGKPQPAQSPLYNMVAPPGTPAELGFDAGGLGIFAHLKGGVRSDGDYGLSAESNDILARSPNPILAAQAQLWGDPSDPAHDDVRGPCGITGTGPNKHCPVPKTSAAFLTLPSGCSEAPLLRVSADSWEEPGIFRSASAQLSDATGNPIAVEGCNQLSFKPAIEARPTTNLADSPSGLDFKLHQPQELELEHLSTAAMRDAIVSLPEGMAVNPASAQGQEACSAAQIGMKSGVGETPIRLSKDPDTCPDAAKIGTVAVSTPLLGHKLEGSVYLAEPFDNPFGSLIAIYVSIEDPQSGTVAKLAGKVTPDPQTGQLSTRFEENPQLPLEDIELHLFGGARAPLTTPIACATHTTTSTLTPWSSPEGVDAHPSDSFAIDSAPGGGGCPSSESASPNSSTFSAGTLAPVAGAYSPFVLKLSRADGSQRLAGIDATLPPGLLGKLAGVGQCSEAQIAVAKSREAPNRGAIEQADPSCPPSSELGSVDVAAGSGPTPIHTQGHAYLAGPYKGAPISIVIITPAVAGPFDLGAVTVKTALYLNPDTAQIHAVSDPLPQILEGIPLDVRSVALKLGRSEFTLNPTSCDPMAIEATSTSSLGQSSNLTSPFQVGGCSQLPFKPKLSLRLKGGTKRTSHPKLIATLKAKPGEANIAKAQVKLPPSAFLDQAHIRTVCTRVQFAANACPKGSIYGTATATTPLLSDPLTGNVYLRSSNHKLPDLVVALKGPASLPIEVDLAGKTDSVKGALRNTFEAVPDAPVSSFRLELFGGKRGLVINSRNLCAHNYKAEVNLDGQNGKVFDTEPAVGTDCGKKPHKKHGKRDRR